MYIRTKLFLGFLIFAWLGVSCRVTPVPVGNPATPTLQVFPPTRASMFMTATSAARGAVLTPTLILPPTQTQPLPTKSPNPEEQLHVVSDESGAISASIPTAWDQVRSIPWTDDQGNVIGVTFIASSDIEAFLSWQAEGVAISVSRKLNKGYIQLLDEEYATLSSKCKDPFHTRWDFENTFHRGKYFVLTDCGGVQSGWLGLFSVVGKEDPASYTARVLAYDMPPTYGDDFRNMLMNFEVFPEHLP